MITCRNIFKIPLVLLLSLFLAILFSASAAADTDAYLGLPFHPFTLDGSNTTCVDYADSDVGPTRNCDPVNLAFPGRSWNQVRDLLQAAGWSIDGTGSHQSLYFTGFGLLQEDEQLYLQANIVSSRHHIRLWQPPGDILVTFAAVHHESWLHTINDNWETAEAYVATQLCGLDCAQTGLLTIQSQIQGDDGEWRDWANDGSITIIPAPTPVNQPPVAAFTPTCTELTCVFDASASYDPDGSFVSYAWDFDDGNSGSGPAPNHTYVAPGSYTVTLTVTDAAAATGTTSQVVTVSDTSPATSHVGDLQGTSIVKRNWQAQVTITIHDDHERLVPNASVSGSWSDGIAGQTTCETGSDGACSLLTAELPKKGIDSVTFTVTNIAHALLDYQPAANHATAIQINKDGTTQVQTPSPPGALTLTAIGYKVKGLQRVDLSWSSPAAVNIYRDGAPLAENISATTYTDNINQKGGGSYAYQVCDATDLDHCSEVVIVTF